MDSKTIWTQVEWQLAPCGERLMRCLFARESIVAHGRMCVLSDVVDKPEMHVHSRKQ